MRDIQHLRPNDGRLDCLFGDIHALLHGRHAEELSPVRLPHCQLRGADDSGSEVPQVLEVRSLPREFFYFSLRFPLPLPASFRKEILTETPLPCSYGGREAQLQARAQEGLKSTEAETKGLLAEAEEKGKGLVQEATRKAGEVKDKVTR